MFQSEFLIKELSNIYEHYKTVGEMPKTKIDPKRLKTLYADIYSITKKCENVTDLVECIMEKPNLARALLVLGCCPTSKFLTGSVSKCTVWNPAVPTVLAAHLACANKKYSEWDLDTLDGERSKAALLLGGLITDTSLKPVEETLKVQPNANILKMDTDIAYTIFDAYVNRNNEKCEVYKFYKNYKILSILRTACVNSRFNGGNAAKPNFYVNYIESALLEVEAEDQELLSIFKSMMTPNLRMMLMQIWLYDTRACPLTVADPITLDTINDVRIIDTVSSEEFTSEISKVKGFNSNPFADL